MNQSKDYVSFTRLVKEEVSVLDTQNNEEKRALLAGFIKINSNLIVRNNGWIINIRSENIKTSKLIIKLIKDLYDIDPRVSIATQKRFRTNNDTKVFYVAIETKAKLILEDLNLYSLEKGFDIIPTYSSRQNQLAKDFIKGCFLAGGSVNSPLTKNYHLEIAFSSYEVAICVVRMLKKFYIDSKIVERRSQSILYVKKSEQIADFLKLIEASNSLLYYEDIRIQRDQINSMNRIINCQVNNEKKAMEKGNYQAEEIRWYKDNFTFKLLDPKLKIIAEIRLANPESTYQELADDYNQIVGGNITKSGISYRMEKLMETISKMRGL